MSDPLTEVVYLVVPLGGICNPAIGYAPTREITFWRGYTQRVPDIHHAYQREDGRGHSKHYMGIHVHDDKMLYTWKLAPQRTYDLVEVRFEDLIGVPCGVYGFQKFIKGKRLYTSTLASIRQWLYLDRLIRAQEASQDEIVKLENDIHE